MQSYDVVRARFRDTLGCAAHYPTSGDLVVEGPFYIYCRQFELRPVDMANVAWGVIAERDPGYYLVRVAGSMRITVRCSATAIIWPIGGRVVSGGVPAAQAFRLQLGSSRASLMFPEVLSCASPTPPATTVNPLFADPVVGMPGCAVASGSKAHTAAAASGYTQLVDVSAVVTPRPVYVLLSIAPSPGDGTGYMQTPIYFTFRATDLPATVWGAPATGVKIGDTTPLRGTQPLAFVINHNVSEVGIWLPELELPASGTFADYTQIDCSVYQAQGVRTVNINGMQSGLPAGYVPVTLPAFNFAEVEGHRGA